MTATTCDTGSGLLRAVLADPASDDSRLIYADYLDEQGEADRAEFVRVQCRIATLNAELMSDEDCDATNCPGCGERRELQRRERELWLMAVAEELPARWVLPPPDGFTFRKLPGDEWGTDGRPHISQAEYRRGFVAEIRLPLALFLEHARDLFAAHPITAVVLTDREPHESVFSNQPESCRWMWIWNDRTFRAAGATLPDGLYHKLRIKSFRDGGHDWAGYPSPVAAHAALSAAAVSLGRELAGLPPLG